MPAGIDPDNPRKRANVVDFVRVSDADGAADDDNADHERRDWLVDLSTINSKGRDHDVGFQDQGRSRRGDRGGGAAAGLADKLIAWVDSLASGNDVLSDRDSVHRHLELLYDATTTDIRDEVINGDR